MRYLLFNNYNNRKLLNNFFRTKSFFSPLRACNQQSCKSFEQIPGPLSLPIIGSLYNYLPIIGPYNFHKLHLNGFKKLQKYGPIVREEIVPGVNVVWLFRPEDIKILFNYEGKCPLRRSHLALEKYRLDRPHIYNTGGLLPTNGQEWLRLRSIFQKGLSSPADVQNFLQGSDEIIQEWLERIEVVARKDNVDYLPELSRLFLELTGFATLDTKFNSFSDTEIDPNSTSSKLINSAFVTNSNVLKTDNGPQLWRKFDTPLYKIFKKAQEFMESVAIRILEQKLTSFNEQDPNKTRTLLQSYLKSPELDFKDIIGVICDFLLAGIDTSTYSTSFLLYHLAKNQDVQETLYKETCKLLPTPSTEITTEILQEAQYAKAVLKESFRLRPISIGVGRILQTDIVFSGYTVPKGTVVVTQNQVTCRLEQYFSNANEFRPERWLRGHRSYQQPHPFLLLPFGHGPRSCIARRLAEQNMLALMMKLIRNFKVDWNGGELDSLSLLINKPDGPILLKFEKR